MIPRCPVRYAQWHTPSEAADRRRDPRWDVASATVLLGIAAGAAVYIQRTYNIELLNFLIPVACLIGAVRDRRADRQVLDLMDLPSEFQQFPCDIKLVRRWGPVQHDQGIVSFVDGLLNFHGLRTSFTLQTNDVESFTASSGCKATVYDGIGGAFDVHFNVRSSFRRGDFVANGLRNRFRTEYRAWMQQKWLGDYVSVLPIIPPTLADIDAERRRLHQPVWVLLALGLAIIVGSTLKVPGAILWIFLATVIVMSIPIGMQMLYIRDLKKIPTLSESEYALLVQSLELRTESTGQDSIASEVRLTVER